MKFKIVLIFCLLNTYGFAQEIPKSLSLEQLMDIVRSNHPIVKSAEIDIERSKASILSAKGAFDPVFSNDIAQKTFNGLNYYQYHSPEIRFPTWFGLEVAAGIENLEGIRSNPTETIGKTSYVGLTVPLAKNLLIDKRRAALKQAKIMNTMSQTEKRIIVNDLLLEAGYAFWAWVRAYQVLQIVNQNVAVNKARVDFIKKSFENGERAAIDTVEAATQLQQFKYLQNQQTLAFQNAGLDLSAFLWTGSNLPASLPAEVIPAESLENTNIDLDDLLSSVATQHPELQLYSQKSDVLAIEKSLKFQDLLPKIDFKYNQLGKGYNLINTTLAGPLFQNNFQYGVKIEMPLRLSAGRGEYKIAQYKMTQINLARSQKLLNLELKVKGYYNEYQAITKQIELLDQNYQSYQQLLRAEEARLANGESSLFLVNARENKVLEAYEKLIDAKIKRNKTYNSIKWAAGLLI